MKLTDSAAAKRCLWIAGTLFLLWVGNATLSNKAYLNPYFYDILIRVGITIILAVSLNLINGFTGQFSLGHAGFMAMGGYAAGAFTYYLEVGWLGVAPLPAWAAQPVLFGAALCFGALVAALAGLLVGIPLLRLRGDYLAIATLGMGEIVRVVILNLEFVGGAKGLSGVPAFTNFFWVFLAAIGTAVVIRNMVRSAHGRALISIREDEVAAEAMGIATTWYKVAAFVIGAAWAGVAGGLHGHFVQGLYPNDFTFLQSIEIVVIVVLGGMGSITGSVAAAALLKILEGTICNVPPKGGRKHPQQEFLQVDTTNVLFVCGGAFVGLNNIISHRIGKKSIGFGTQQISQKAQNISEMLRKVEPEDLLKFGMIPEFVGRIPVITTLDELSEEDLVRILIEPKNALIKQYKKLMELEGVELEVSEKGIRAIAQEAIKRKTGARGLRAIMEGMMLEIMYMIPSTPTVKSVIIDENVILNRAQPLMVYQDNKEQERKLRIS